MDSDSFSSEILNAIPLRVVILNLEGKIISCNSSFEKDARYSLKFCKDKCISEFFSETDIFYKFFEKVIKTEMEYHNIKGEIVTLDRQKLYINFDIIPQYNETRKLSHLLLCYKNISAPQMLKETTKLDETMVSFEYYARCIIHEIRNPLMAITGASQMLKNKKMSQEEEKYVEMITDESKRIQRILNDIEMSNLDNDLNLSLINIHQALDRAIMVMNHHAVKKKKNIEIVREYDPSLPEVEADLERLVQVFINIIKNAIEASSENQQVIVETRFALDQKISLSEKEKPLKYFLVRIIDKGVGISKENIDKIFIPLYSSKSKGEGVGLAICRQIIKAHHGTILVESEINIQTTFSIYLPLN
ncbi:MAG: GHKL domain-containing protein [Nitrospinae bacterium]|nr:GHKL domain-containing protein [Nitrospinota bacterium]